MLKTLRKAGFKLALCSNLAAPYAVPVKLLLPPLGAYAWSFEVGAVKPEPSIYNLLFDRLDCSAREIMMVGDTPESDCSAPRRLSMLGFHIARQGESPVAESIRTLYEVIEPCLIVKYLNLNERNGKRKTSENDCQLN